MSIKSINERLMYGKDFIKNNMGNIMIGEKQDLPFDIDNQEK